MPILAVLGIILIVLAVFHIIPLVLGLVLGIILVIVGCWPFYGGYVTGRGPRRY